MSQYPPNPQHPQYPYPPQPMYGYGDDPRDELLRPARRASVMMFVIAGLLLVCGGLCGLATLLPVDQLDDQQRAQLEQLEAEAGISFRTIVGTAAAMMLVPGVLLGVMGMIVRGGGMASAITSLILCVLIGLVLLLGVASSLINAMQDRAAIAGTCVLVAPLALLVVVIVWLIQALRNAPRLADLRMNEQSAYWQSQQQRQQYGGDFWQQQPPPPPPPPPQP